MTDYIINLITPTIEHIGVAGYWIALFTAMLETTIGIGLLLPGSTIILLLGAASAHGYLDLWDLIWFAVVGAVIGDNINYFLGQKYGTRWTKKGFRFFKEELFNKAKDFFDAHGAKSVFLGRFVPSIKEIMPFIAGSVGMRHKTFLLWNILGAIGWGFEWIFAGYVFAQSMSLAKMWLSRMGFLLAALFLVFFVFYIIKLAVLKFGRPTFSLAASVWLSIKDAVITNSDVQKLVGKHPDFFKSLANRFIKDRFTGLPLTLLGLAFLYVLILFGGIVEDLITGDPIVVADKHIANLFIVFRTPQLIKVFSWITLLGKSQVVLSFIIALTGTLWLLKKRWYVFPFFTTIVGSELFTYLGKLAFHRSRPVLPVYAEHTFSFPSGHATIAVAFYGFVTYVLIDNARQWKTKVNLFFAGIIVILLIGFSRLYLGEHYLSDVWAGYLVGAIWLIIGISISQWLQFGKAQIPVAMVSGKVRAVCAFLVLCSILIYIGFARQYHPRYAVSSFSSKAEIVKSVKDIFSDEQMKYAENTVGRKQEPMNFIIYARDDQQLLESFQKAGWLSADQITLLSIARLLEAYLLNRFYPTAPITPMFWNSYVNDFGFEKPTAANTIRERHHVRFWKTYYKTNNGESLYIGTASFDAGIKWFVTHRINPNIDAEREYLLNDLKKSVRIADIEKIEFTDPKIGQNFTGDFFFTDGKAYVINLDKAQTF